MVVCFFTVQQLLTLSDALNNGATKFGSDFEAPVLPPAVSATIDNFRAAREREQHGREEDRYRNVVRRLRELELPLLRNIHAEGYVIGVGLPGKWLCLCLCCD